MANGFLYRADNGALLRRGAGRYIGAQQRFPLA